MKSFRADKPYTTAAVCLFACATLIRAQGNAPDRIYVNGTVITMNGAQIVEAVAVRGDRIVGAGSNADIRKMAGSGTVVVDLKGKTMLPGLIDTHSHFPGSGTSALFTVNLSSPPLGKCQQHRRSSRPVAQESAGNSQGPMDPGKRLRSNLAQRGTASHPIRSRQGIH